MLHEYISELRSEIYFAQKEDFSLILTFSLREYPYRADGVKGTMQNIVEATLITENTATDVTLYFIADDTRYGGEMSFDNTAHSYYFSQSATTATSPVIDAEIIYNNQSQTVNLQLQRARSGKELSHAECLNMLLEARYNDFQSFWVNARFQAEIYCRLIYDETCFWLFTLQNNTSCHCYLLNASTGSIITEK